VAMITGASISAPILASLDVNLVLAAQAAALGAMIFSYFNDSLFWVVNRMLGIKDVKEQLLVWSVPTTLGWFVSLIMLLVADFVVRLSSKWCLNHLLWRQVKCCACQLMNDKRNKNQIETYKQIRCISIWFTYTI